MEFISDITFRRPSTHSISIIMDLHIMLNKVIVLSTQIKSAALGGTLSQQSLGFGSHCPIDSFTQFLAGFEVRHVFLRHTHFITRFRIAPLPGGTMV